jgi:metal-responsive CopG/Arc/MetJ family transcriptional regulator
MKTAISIPDEIFINLDRLSKELNCSRSHLFLEAIKEFLMKIDNQKILSKLNNVYTENENKVDSKYLKGIRRKYTETITDKW